MSTCSLVQLQLPWRVKLQHTRHASNFETTHISIWIFIFSTCMSQSTMSVCISFALKTRHTLFLLTPQNIFEHTIWLYYYLVCILNQLKERLVMSWIVSIGL